jgi:hypothetical protein
MKRWGIIISVFYLLVVLLLLFPATLLLAGVDDFWSSVRDTSSEWLFWLFIGVLFSGQALLLFLSVDTTWRKLKPRAHLMFSVAVISMLVALLAFAVIWCIAAAIYGDHVFDWKMMERAAGYIVPWAILWVIWGILFYLFSSNASNIVSKAISWLLRGSVLELLIAVPCHVVVRHRRDCSAPVVTSFGITTGIAIMLLSFGPSVLFLYKKRMDEYSSRKVAKISPDNSSNSVS